MVTLPYIERELACMPKESMAKNNYWHGFAVVTFSNTSIQKMYLTNYEHAPCDIYGVIY
jgi:hypothetical protein